MAHKKADESEAPVEKAEKPAEKPAKAEKAPSSMKQKLLALAGDLTAFKLRVAAEGAPPALVNALNDAAGQAEVAAAALKD
jgi:hypothetical protein